MRTYKFCFMTVIIAGLITGCGVKNYKINPISPFPQSEQKLSEIAIFMSTSLNDVDKDMAFIKNAIEFRVTQDFQSAILTENEEGLRLYINLTKVKESPPGWMKILLGAFAGGAQVKGEVTISDVESGDQIGKYTVEGNPYAHDAGNVFADDKKQAIDAFVNGVIDGLDKHYY